MSLRNLAQLMSPASVAVFGASNRPCSVGATVWHNLRQGRFAGPLWPVNPKHSQLDGVAVYQNAQQLPGVPELALLCTPPRTLAPLVKQLGEMGTRAVVVYTAGLNAQQRQAMLEAARPHLLRVLGPNGIGLINPYAELNASFSHCGAQPGKLAFVSQSGALVTAVLDWARGRGIGFSSVVSLGEQADVDFGDMLDYLAGDPQTRAILLYIESIKAPRKFMSAARAAARNKPVIVVKGGRSSPGQRAAASHTGALATSDRVYDAAIRRAGMLRVETLQALFGAAQALAHLRFTPTEDLMVVTNGGGAGVLAADAAARLGVNLAELGPTLGARLDACLPPGWSGTNPVDIVGDAPASRYVDAVRCLLAAAPKATVLFLHAPTAIVRSEEVAKGVLPLLEEARGRVMTCWLGDAAVARARELTAQAGIADYATPEEAVHAFAALQTYRRNQEALMQTPESSANAGPGKAQAMSVISTALKEGRGWLSQAQAFAVLAAYGVPVIEGETVAPDTRSVLEAAARLGYPVALKAASAQLIHKSDVGGVCLGIADPPALERAVEIMRASVALARPDVTIEGFTVQAMAQRPKARDVIVGAGIDPVFGPVILCGQGGTAVEVMDDCAIALPPLNRGLASELIGRTGLPRLLGAWRDRPAAKQQALQDVLVAVSSMLAQLPMLAELDINPLLVDEHGALALDARIRLAPDSPCGIERFAILPYPADWVRTLEWQGRQVTLRPIRPEDEPQHARFLESAPPEDMRMRFFCARHAPAHTELARLTQIDYDREMAFIIEAKDARGQDETLAVGRTVSDPDLVEAEFALMVRSDLKRHGLGRLLLVELIRHARHRGIERLSGIVLRENLAMLALARDLGFVEEADAATAPDARRVVLHLRESAGAPAPSVVS
ncbi:bifunctional acetate--CoA ligase family protein/GNAT family N-acetyltransferase [Variovorax soli]|uniref:bifunctional acetate--CoA ligase family protein/GNAT family N-acetyltransferase n=1 Tax=Variovorax soli TaxID=376815 RepID=UPI000839943A|nr:bifunctional acetate--CoA ligase family protein/GNAT family N-acetyltransferase [Variovorax soli]